ncbi:MAG TPA: MerR family transcriptional regulator [Actinomycetota bacterium]|nr:MerR family transcriptional regulator [Actinomycetota bacterium]
MEDHQGRYQIGEVAGRVGLSPRTVRYYGEVGLVAPSGRTQGGFRLYTDDDIARLLLIKQLKPLDFTLEELRDLLDTRSRLGDPATDPARHGELLERLAGYARVAEQRCTQLREQLAAVEAVTRTLQREARMHRSRASSPERR